MTKSSAPASRAMGSDVANPTSRQPSQACNAPQASSQMPQYCGTSHSGWIALKRKASNGMESA
nr:hypothetical protein [Roseococcus microcysteis]